MDQNRNTKGSSSIKFSVPWDLKLSLQELAMERNISLSALLRLITSEYIKRNNGT
jgi:hypothetical protein